MADAIREMQLRLAEAESLGTGPAVDGLRLVGLTLKDLDGLNAPAKFALLRDRISEVEDPAKRLFLADELLGGSTERLQGLIGLTVDEYAKLKAKTDAQRVATEENIGAIKDLTTGFSSLIKTGLVVAINTVGSLIRLFQEFTDMLGITNTETKRQAEAVELSVTEYGELREKVTQYGASADRIRQTERNLSELRIAGNITLAEQAKRLESVIEGEIQHALRAREAERATGAFSEAIEAGARAGAGYTGTLQAQREELSLVALQAGHTPDGAG